MCSYFCKQTIKNTATLAKRNALFLFCVNAHRHSEYWNCHSDTGFTSVSRCVDKVHYSVSNRDLRYICCFVSLLAYVKITETKKTCTQLGTAILVTFFMFIHIVIFIHSYLYFFLTVQFLDILINK